MSFLVVDSGALTALAEQSGDALALQTVLRREGLWPPTVPAAVLVESLTGDGRRDARTHLLLNVCNVVDRLPRGLARRAATLRTRARRGSAVDAIVVASAEPSGTVLTSDPVDCEALAAYTVGVHIRRV